MQENERGRCGAGQKGDLAVNSWLQQGYLIALGLPLAAIVCFIWPERLMWWLSPRTPPNYAYLLTEGAWYILGYALLIVGMGVLFLFR